MYVKLIGNRFVIKCPQYWSGIGEGTLKKNLVIDAKARVRIICPFYQN